MKTYNVTLKGTKKNNTETITVKILAGNKPHAFNLAYGFFQKGEVNAVFGNAQLGFSTYSDYIFGANELSHLAGKYHVHMSQVKCN